MTVASVGLIVFGLLLATNFMVFRSLIYPGVAFAGIWFLEFLVLLAAQGAIYPVSWAALAVFVTGAVCFMAGAALAYRAGGRPDRPVTSVAIQPCRGDTALLWFFVVVLVAGLPFFARELSHLATDPWFSLHFFQQVRRGFLEQANTMSRVPLVNNLVILSIILAIVGYALSDGLRRNRAAASCLIGLALIYTLLTGARSGALQLVIALFAIHALLRRRVSARGVVLAAAVVLALFGIVTIWRGYGGDAPTLTQSLVVTWHRFVVYFCAGPVGFSTYLNHPDLVPSVWSPWLFFERTANYFGHYFDVPSIHAQFFPVGPGAEANVYTAFFSYYPAYGIAGVVGFGFALGVVCSLVYRRALSGGLVWLALYGFLFYGIVMTVFGEFFLLTLNPTLKLALVALLVTLWRGRIGREASAGAAV